MSINNQDIQPENSRKLFLRQNLEIINTEDGSMEIKDPNNGKYYYMVEQDALVIKMLEEVDAQDFLEQTNYDLEHLIDLVKSLKQYNLLEGLSTENNANSITTTKKLELFTPKEALYKLTKTSSNYLKSFWTTPYKLTVVLSLVFVFSILYKLDFISYVFK